MSKRGDGGGPSPRVAGESLPPSMGGRSGDPGRRDLVRRGVSGTETMVV